MFSFFNHNRSREFFTPNPSCKRRRRLFGQPPGLIRAGNDRPQENPPRQAGFSRQTINPIENDKYSPSLTKAFNLARIFDQTIVSIFEPEETVLK